MNDGAFSTFERLGEKYSGEGASRVMADEYEPLTLTIGRKHFIATDLTDASRIYQRERDDSGQGSGTFPDGRVGKYRISYNGRVWHGKRLVQEATK